MQNILALVVSNALLYATPLIFTALGGVFSERSGIVNVGLEGIMVIGAFSSVVFNLTFAGQFGDLTPWLALLVGGLCGLLFALIHAVATVNLRADHIISGTVLNLIAPSLAIFLTKVLSKVRVKQTQSKPSLVNLTSQSYQTFQLSGQSSSPKLLSWLM